MTGDSQFLNIIANEKFELVWISVVCPLWSFMHVIMLLYYMLKILSRHKHQMVITTGTWWDCIFLLHENTCNYALLSGCNGPQTDVYIMKLLSAKHSNFLYLLFKCWISLFLKSNVSFFFEGNVSWFSYYVSRMTSDLQCEDIDMHRGMRAQWMIHTKSQPPQADYQQGEGLSGHGSHMSL